MKDTYMLKCLSVIGIILLEAIALLKDVDGVYFGTVMTILGVVLGVGFKEEIENTINYLKELRASKKVV